jgi:DNA-binding MarR family transcriptional regulator
MEKKASLNTAWDIGKYVSILYRIGVSHFSRRMRENEIESGQHAFLFYLFSHNGSSQDEISKALSLDKATTTRAINRLESQKFVERQRDSEDHRINRVFLTEEGKNLESSLRSISKEWESILLKGFSDHETQLLKEMLLRLSDNAVQYKLTKL